MQPERSNQELSSGAGELSDSMSMPEVGVSHIRKKKSRVRELLLVPSSDYRNLALVLLVATIFGVRRQISTHSLSDGWHVCNQEFANSVTKSHRTSSMPNIWASRRCAGTEPGLSIGGAGTF